MHGQVHKHKIEPCDICGDVGFDDFIVTCSKCKVTREHVYCMRINLMKIPDFWLCEKCEPNSGDNNVRKGVDEVIKLPLQEKENVRFAATISLQTVSVVNFKLQKRFLTTKGVQGEDLAWTN
ncbi:hypothetical protein P8452_20487 [Trifolium repens]|nr:hypothetical protein P8452_20487 [Trifolium repens]